MEITRQQYEYALERIEELLPTVDDQTPVNDRNVVELALLSEVVIFTMSPDKSYEHISHNKFDDNHKSIFITSDIEDIPLIAYIIYRREIRLHLSQIPPLGLQYYVIPSFQGHPGIFPTRRLIKLLQLPM